MARQAISIGFPSPNYVCETGTDDAILPGEYIVETSAGPVPAPPAQRPWRHVALAADDEADELTWQPSTRRFRSSTPPITRRKLRPYLQINT